jgi:hypothetical protein
VCMGHPGLAASFMRTGEAPRRSRTGSPRPS